MITNTTSSYNIQEAAPKATKSAEDRNMIIEVPRI